MGRRSEHSRSELRQLIIDATGALIDEHGVGKVTARMIAEAVDYTPGMLYSVFRNLEDIFRHVNELSLDKLQSTCKTASDAADTPIEAIQAIGQAYHDFAHNHTHRFSLLFDSSISRQHAERGSLNESARTLFDLVRLQLTRINPAADESALEAGACALWSGLHGATLSSGLKPGVALPWHADATLIQTLLSYCLEGWIQEFGEQ